MVCPNCGEEVASGSIFCLNCGERVTSSGGSNKHQTNKSGNKKKKHDGNGGKSSGGGFHFSQKDKLFSKEGLFSFAGRRARKEYLIMFIIANLLAKLSEPLLCFILRPTARLSMSRLGIAIALTAFIILLSFYLECTNVGKRLHDFNYPAYPAFIIAILPIFIVAIGVLAENLPVIIFGLVVGLALNLALLFKQGDKGPNLYGEDPAV